MYTAQYFIDKFEAMSANNFAESVANLSWNETDALTELFGKAKIENVLAGYSNYSGRQYPGDTKKERVIAFLNRVIAREAKAMPAKVAKLEATVSDLQAKLDGIRDALAA